MAKFLKSILSCFKKPIKSKQESVQSETPLNDQTFEQEEEQLKKPQLKPCKICGEMPKIEEGRDTLQIVCSCGNVGEVIFGDYYDEALMLAVYGDLAIYEWNRNN